MYSALSPRAFVGRFGVALLVVVVLMTGVVVGVNARVRVTLNGIHRIPLKTDASLGPGQPANILMIGSDSRSFVANQTQRNAFGDTQNAGGQRSDTIMVLHVDPQAKKVLLVSFPRDLWVDIPGTGPSKINAAFNSGPQKVIDTLKANFQIPINHYMEVDFQSFQGVVDALGTVPVYFPLPTRDLKTGLNEPAGCQALNGQQALQYVRSRYLQVASFGKWRYPDPIPDLGRIARQQAFLRKLAMLAVRKGLNNPLAANDIASSVLSKLQISQSFSTDDILRLINAFRSVNPGDPNSIQTMTLATHPAAIGGQDVLQMTQPDANSMLTALRTFTSSNATSAVANGPKPATIRVRVLNRANGVGGAAGKALTSFQQDGFVGVGVGNVGRNVAKTEVRYASGALEKAKVVQSYLAGVGTLIPDASLTDTDVAVVLGQDYTAVTLPAGATA
ncbi:MAG: transcriptional attenuator, LytR family, partial [Actinomycetia bacterium]|nr:transcriptional attenuator, LytR family [Actinomycetes bacterium]